MVRGFYSEISLRNAMSKQHMKLIKKQKRAKKSQAYSYLNFKTKIFYLDQILDQNYWRFHNSFAKTKYVPSIQGEQNDFISIETGLSVYHLSWVNKIDSVMPYQTGY